MTFKEFLKQKKDIDCEGMDLNDLMDEHYEEYTDFMREQKDGCSDSAPKP